MLAFPCLMAYIIVHGLQGAAQQPGKTTMSKFEVSNAKSSTSFGIYEAHGAEQAIEAACRDAGYDSNGHAEEVMGHESDLVAVEVE